MKFVAVSKQLERRETFSSRVKTATCYKETVSDGREHKAVANFSAKVIAIIDFWVISSCWQDLHAWQS